MIHYDYDINGWLIGWHDGDTRPNSTPLPYAPIPPRRARFVAGAWTDDPGQEQADAAAASTEAAERTARQEARAYFRDLDWSKITDPETRKALRHLWRIVKRLDTDGA